MGSVQPFTTIEGPEAWTAADYKGRTDWINVLSETHVAELDAAVSGVIARGIKDRDIHVSLRHLRPGGLLVVAGTKGVPAAAKRGVLDAAQHAGRCSAGEKVQNALKYITHMSGGMWLG
jgi:hypothetical protein